MSDRILDGLAEFWNQVIKELSENLEKAKRVASSVTKDSILAPESLEVTLLQRDNYKVVIRMPDYYEFIDEGVKGKGGGKGGGGGSAAPSVEAALGFLRAQAGPVGLVDSFVEDNADYAYTYDNALAAMAFISRSSLTISNC